MQLEENHELLGSAGKTLIGAKSPTVAGAQHGLGFRPPNTAVNGERGHGPAVQRLIRLVRPLREQTVQVSVCEQLARRLDPEMVDRSVRQGHVVCSNLLVGRLAVDMFRLFWIEFGSGLDQGPCHQGPCRTWVWFTWLRKLFLPNLSESKRERICCFLMEKN